ncbi:hypothetical protein QBC43DRAFT_243308 [Cladorrhinum sp. PSN259]|nr:hypothetical protein QBC43DRAFT_243308 [Cladorrhinum sp. PSN259]
MGVRAMVRRVRDFLSRTGKKVKHFASSAKGKGCDDAALAIYNGPFIQVTRAEMQAAENDQDTSVFFSRLPLEVRQLIYLEVWKDYLKPRRTSPSKPGTDLRLHIYTDDSANLKLLRHTQCKVHPIDPPHEDTLYATTPWLHDTDMNPNVPAPGWFWFAWVLRIHWGKHWKCQHAVQRRWDPRTGTSKEVPPAPFLSVFLTCKKMYSEAIVSFFENVTPIFTCSRDATRFFMEAPHPYLEALRSVEFNLCNVNDYLYLSKIWRDPVSRAAAHRMLHPNEPSDDDDYQSARVVHRTQTRLIGKELWDNLIQGMRVTTPYLRDMEIYIAGRIKKHEILMPFGYNASEEELKDTNTIEAINQSPHTPEEQVDDTEPITPWILRGLVHVTFCPSGALYLQREGNMILYPHPAQLDEVVHEED